MSRDPRIDAYIAARADFARPILIWLRDRVHAACPAVEEPIKWGMPAFSYCGRPFAGMAAFKAHATFGLRYRHDMPMGREGEAMGQYGRLTGLSDLPDAATIDRQIAQTMALIDSGTPSRRVASAPRLRSCRPSVTSGGTGARRSRRGNVSWLCAQRSSRILRMDRGSAARRNPRKTRG